MSFIIIIMYKASYRKPGQLFLHLNVNITLWQIINLSKGGLKGDLSGLKDITNNKYLQDQKGF